MDIKTVLKKCKLEVNKRFPNLIEIMIIAGSLILALKLSLYGFNLDFKGYLVNLLSGLTGVCIGIVIAFLLIDRFNKYQRKKQWEKVCEVTYQAIASHLCDLNLKALIHYGMHNINQYGELLMGRLKPTSDILNVMDRVIDYLRNKMIEAERNQDSKKKSSLKDTTLEYYKDIKWHIDSISEVLIPRITQTSSEQNLIDTFIKFDDTIRKLHTNIILFNAHLSLSSLNQLINLLQEGRDIYKLLVEKNYS